MTKAELISYLREIDKVFQTEEKAFDAKFNAQRALGQLGHRKAVPPKIKSFGANLLIILICIFVIGAPALMALGFGSYIVTGLFIGSNWMELPWLQLILCILPAVLGVFAVKAITRISLRNAEREIERVKRENAEQEERERPYLEQIHAEIRRAEGVINACYNKIEVYKRQGILHEEYLHIGAVEYICECLEKGRADTLKEALNLYETFHYQLQQEMRADAFRAEQLENQRQILENQQAYQEGLSQLQQEVAQARREAAIDGFISAIGTDNAIRARKEIERANGKIV